MCKWNVIQVSMGANRKFWNYYHTSYIKYSWVTISQRIILWKIYSFLLLMVQGDCSMDKCIHHSNFHHSNFYKVILWFCNCPWIRKDSLEAYSDYKSHRFLTYIHIHSLFCPAQLTCISSRSREVMQVWQRKEKV